MTGQPESVSAGTTMARPDAAPPCEASTRPDGAALSTAFVGHEDSAAVHSEATATPAVAPATTMPLQPMELDDSSSESDTVEVPVTPHKRKHREASTVDASRGKGMANKRANVEHSASEVDCLREENKCLREENVALRARLFETEAMGKQDGRRGSSRTIEVVGDALAVEAPDPPRALCVICRQVPLRPQVSALCGHFACDECWGRWVCVKFECPVCRAKVRPNNLIRMRAWGDC
jgi:hypothetical protein